MFNYRRHKLIASRGHVDPRERLKVSLGEKLKCGFSAQTWVMRTFKRIESVQAGHARIK